MSADGKEARDGADVAWYARPEQSGTWRIPACPEHGRELERHRFAYAGPRVEFFGAAREAEHCEVCRDPELPGRVERCTCEQDTARCPEHQNIGCGG